MPQTPHADFVAEKNKGTNAPIWLYHIGTLDVRLAEYDSDVVYDGQTYTAFPIRHSGIEQSSDGSVSILRVTVANVSREMQSFVENNDALRGYEVTIKVVFANLLANNQAFASAKFLIDSCTCDEKAIVFDLRPKLDLMDMMLPRRMYQRHHCPWIYKLRGCWLEDGVGGYTMPTGFDTDDDTGGLGDTCGKRPSECERHNNLARYGGFVAVPSRPIWFA